MGPEKTGPCGAGSDGRQLGNAQSSSVGVNGLSTRPGSRCERTREGGLHPGVDGRRTGRGRAHRGLNDTVHVPALTRFASASPSYFGPFDLSHPDRAPVLHSRFLCSTLTVRPCSPASTASLVYSSYEKDSLDTLQLWYKHPARSTSPSARFRDETPPRRSHQRSSRTMLLPTE